MITSRELHLTSSGDDTKEVLAEAMRFAADRKLSEKDALRVRLLTEETMAMLRTMTGSLELGLRFIGRDDCCIIELETDTPMNALKREDLLELSRSGKNAAAKGIMGKIRAVFEMAFSMPAEGVWADYCDPSMLQGMPGDLYTTQMMDTMYWSLSSYKQSVSKNGEGEEQCEKWDELEKSIVSKLASDVQVGVRGRHVVMSIVYKLQ